jgi:hypothetical protein
MKLEDLKYFKTWFANYVDAYYTDDPVHNQPVRLKREHTERVCQEIVMLGQAMNLTKENILLAETMALFHDVGRFEQYAVHGTFKDAVSEDHAQLGIKVLAERQVLSICSDMEKSLITKAIGYHNLRTLPEEGDERSLFFARLLRDADKLDIWRVFIDYYARQNEEREPNSTIVLGLPDERACSPAVLDALRDFRMADLKDMVTLNDFKLLQMSWVFDLNFGPTFRVVRDRRYIEEIAARLPRTQEISRVVGIVQGYVKEQNAAFNLVGKEYN